MIAVVDYGRGNLWSVQNGFAQVGVRVQVSADPEIVRQAEAVVFPGVGAFRDCMHNLTARGLDQALREVIDAGRPVLAICVGMQALLTESEEFGLTPGMAIVGSPEIVTANTAEFNAHGFVMVGVDSTFSADGIIEGGITQLHPWQGYTLNEMGPGPSPVTYQMSYDRGIKIGGNTSIRFKPPPETPPGFPATSGQAAKPTVLLWQH